MLGSLFAAAAWQVLDSNLQFFARYTNMLLIRSRDHKEIVDSEYAVRNHPPEVEVLLADAPERIRLMYVRGSGSQELLITKLEASKVVCAQLRVAGTPPTHYSWKGNPMKFNFPSQLSFELRSADCNLMFDTSNCPDRDHIDHIRRYRSSIRSCNRRLIATKVILPSCPHFVSACMAFLV